MKIPTPFPPSSTPRTPPKKAPTHSEIAQRARRLWQEQGCPEGRDEIIWLEAERQLLGRPQFDPSHSAPPASSDEDDEEIRFDDKGDPTNQVGEHLEESSAPGPQERSPTTL